MSRTSLTITTAFYLVALMVRGSHVVDHLGAHFHAEAEANHGDHGDLHEDDREVVVRSYCGGPGPCKNPEHEHGAPHSEDECVVCKICSKVHASVHAEGSHHALAPSAPLLAAQQRTFLPAVSVEIHSARGPPVYS